MTARRVQTGSCCARRSPRWPSGCPQAAGHCTSPVRTSVAPAFRRQPAGRTASGGTVRAEPATSQPISNPGTGSPPGATARSTPACAPSVCRPLPARMSTRRSGYPGTAPPTTGLRNPDPALDDQSTAELPTLTHRRIASPPSRTEIRRYWRQLTVGMVAGTVPRIGISGRGLFSRWTVGREALPRLSVACSLSGPGR